MQMLPIEVFQSCDIGGKTEPEESKNIGKMRMNELDYINMDIIKLSSNFLSFQTLR